MRATGSYIKGTGGTSNGIIPMLRVFNDAARYVDQCFHPDTLIYTRQGIKRIDDIVLGEELLTAEGEFNRVSQDLRRIIPRATWLRSVSNIPSSPFW